MEYTKLKLINNYKSESIDPSKTPDMVFEMYSVPIYDTGHPEYLLGSEIASNKVVVKKNDVLLCKINPRINRVWVVADESEHTNIASSEWIVVRNSEYNPDFLAWYFKSPRFKQLMVSEVTGIGGSLTRAQPKAVAEYPVPVLPRPEQDEIAKILNKIASVIRTRQQELSSLDDLIKARFVEMFGDPIHNEKGFDTKLGTDVFKLSNGKFVPENKRLESGIPVYGGNGISWYTDEVLFEGDTIVVGRVGFQSGNVHLAEGPLWISDNAMYISALYDDGYDLRFLYWLMEHINFSRFQDAGDLKKITQKPFMQMQYIKPPISMQLDYKAFVAQIDKSKDAIKKSLAETQTLFDSLMQKYFG